MALTCWSRAKLSRLTWRPRTAEAVLIALAGLVYIGLMRRHDTVTNDKQGLGRLGLYYLQQFAALLLPVDWPVPVTPARK